jgi:hypothetical protein
MMVKTFVASTGSVGADAIRSAYAKLDSEVEQFLGDTRQLVSVRDTMVNGMHASSYVVSRVVVYETLSPVGGGE